MGALSRNLPHLLSDSLRSIDGGRDESIGRKSAREGERRDKTEIISKSDYRTHRRRISTGTQTKRKMKFRFRLCATAAQQPVFSIENSQSGLFIERPAQREPREHQKWNKKNKKYCKSRRRQLRHGEPINLTISQYNLLRVYGTLLAHTQRSVGIYFVFFLFFSLILSRSLVSTAIVAPRASLALCAFQLDTANTGKHRWQKYKNKNEKQQRRCSK